MSRVVFFHPSPEWDSLARVYLETGKALAARGVTVGIACPAGSPVAAACAVFDQLPFDDRGSWFSDGLRLATQLRDYGCDATIVAGDDAQLVAAWAVRRSGRGAVLRRIGSGAVAPVTMRTRLAVRLAPTWFIHGTATEAQASEPVNRLRGRIVADLAIDPLQFDRVVAAPTPIGTSTFAIVTNCEAQRATAAALRAIAAMRTRGHPINTLLVGTPHDVNEVRVHATALGFGDALAFVGEPEPVDRAAMLAAADMVWVVAEHDDGGLAVLDAMALGRPIIVTRGTMAERYVRDGDTGIIVERDDALATAAEITLLGADAIRMNSIAEMAKADVRARRGLSMVADAVMTVLQDAAAAQVAA
ncbi:MAG TPA: glycosyltransferase [Gemmatimonadaceae bacterium]|nr:glycosyltransferase [Gemmatimonadaceae bacterium]